MKLTIGRKIGIAMAVMIGLLAISAIAANLSIIKLRSRIDELVTRSSPLIIAAYRMDTSKVLARLELRNYFAERDLDKLEDIEKRYFKHISAHDAYELQIGQAIDAISDGRQSIKAVWEKGIETVMPQFNRAALKAMDAHKDYLKIREKKISVIEKHSSNSTSLANEISELQKQYFNYYGFNKSLSSLKDIFAKMILVEEKYHVTSEMITKQQRKELVNRYKRKSDEFSGLLRRFKSDVSARYGEDITDKITAVFSNIIDSSLGEEGMFALSEREIEFSENIGLLLDDLDRLSIEDSKMANQLLNLARTKLEKAGVEAHNTVMIISKEMIAFCILAVIVSWVVVSILSKQIVRPVAALSNASRSIANGRNVEKVEYSSSDEIGQLCKCFNNMNRELNRQVEEREKAESHNRRLLEILEEKNKELQNVVYVASHDLKSPLVTINGFSEEVRGLCNDIRKVIEAEPFNGEVKDKVMTLLREDIPQDLKFISAGANKMQMLIGGLLQVSRIGTAVVNMEALHMNDLLKKVEESIQYSIIEKKVELNIDNLPMCYGDETMINQVFSNLLDNAIKYLDDNRDPVINVVGWREGDKCIYCVSDNGVGISEKNQSKIFEIFHRLDPHGQVQGDGLGLTIVGRILERHGGSIWVESETGVGSSFFVSLPSVSQKDWKQ